MTFKVIWPFRLISSFLYTDLGQPRGVTCPKHALVTLVMQTLIFRKHTDIFAFSIISQH